MARADTALGSEPAREASGYRGAASCRLSDRVFARTILSPLPATAAMLNPRTIWATPRRPPCLTTRRIGHGAKLQPHLPSAPRTARSRVPLATPTGSGKSRRRRVTGESQSRQRQPQTSLPRASISQSPPFLPTPYLFRVVDCAARGGWAIDRPRLVHGRCDRGGAGPCAGNAASSDRAGSTASGPRRHGPMASPSSLRRAHGGPLRLVYPRRAVGLPGAASKRLRWAWPIADAISRPVDWSNINNTTRCVTPSAGPIRAPNIDMLGSRGDPPGRRI